MPCSSLNRDMTRVDPMDSSDDFGCNLYKRLISIVECHGCNACVMHARLDSYKLSSVLILVENFF